MSTETQLAVVEQEIQQTQNLLGRVDHAIEKLTDVTADIGKILAVHDQRLERGEKATSDIFDLLEKRRNEMDADIKEIHSRITTTTRELSTEIANVQTCVVNGIEDLKKELKEDQRYHNEKQKSLEERIASLERWRYTLVGAGIVGGYVLTKLIGMVDIAIK
jgi:conjugal transfer/entry exclusion protein